MLTPDVSLRALIIHTFCGTTVLLKLDLIQFIQKGSGKMLKSGL